MAKKKKERVSIKLKVEAHGENAELIQSTEEEVMWFELDADEQVLHLFTILDSVAKQSKYGVKQRQWFKELDGGWS